MNDEEDDYAKLVVSNAELSATAAALKADNERLRAMLPSPEWMPLKVAAADSGITYETARSWCAAGWVEARRVGGRWLVNRLSMAARARISHRIAS